MCPRARKCRAFKPRDGRHDIGRPLLSPCRGRRRRKISFCESFIRLHSLRANLRAVALRLDSKRKSLVNSRGFPYRPPRPLYEKSEFFVIRRIFSRPFSPSRRCADEDLRLRARSFFVSPLSCMLSREMFSGFGTVDNSFGSASVGKQIFRRRVYSTFLQ